MMKIISGGREQTSSRGRFVIPTGLSRAIVDLHGDEGRRWLFRLPGLIDEVRELWSLELGHRYAPLTYSYVIAARKEDGEACVLKATVPGRELDSEIAALRAFDGRGTVMLLDADPSRGVMLIERLAPGKSLVVVRDERVATSTAAELIREIRTPVTATTDFPTTAEWGDGLIRLRRYFLGGTGPFPKKLVAAAESLFQELNDSTPSMALLHGDLHHRNILAAERRPWLAIDPKGVVGDPAYEAGVLLRNPLPELLETPRPGALLSRRIDRLSRELEIDRMRLLGWGIAQAVLAAWWRFEDHRTGWQPLLVCGSLLLDIFRRRRAARRPKSKER